MRMLDESVVIDSANRALLYIMCAHAAKFYALEYSDTTSPLSREIIQMAGSQWAKMAKDMYFSDYSTISVVKLKVLVLLHDHEARLGNYAGSFLLTGLIVRMAHALQLHTESKEQPGVPNDVSLRESRRRLMWACYMVDVWAGSGVDQLTILNEKDIKLQLPCNERQFLLQIPHVTETLQPGEVLDHLKAEDIPGQPWQNMGMSAYFVRIAYIWKRVLRSKQDAETVTSRTLELVELNNQALRAMSQLYPLAEPLYINTERWLEKVRESIARGAPLDPYIPPQDPANPHPEEMPDSSMDSSSVPTPIPSVETMHLSVSQPMHPPMTNPVDSMMDMSNSHPTNGNFVAAKAAEGKVDLPEDDPEMVAYMIKYMGEIEYQLPSEDIAGPWWIKPDWPNCNEELSAETFRSWDSMCWKISTRTLDSLMERFLAVRKKAADDAEKLSPDACPLAINNPDAYVHANIYSIAEKHNIKGLKQEAAQRFEKSLDNMSSGDSFYEAVRVAFTTTLSTDMVLRDMIAKYVCNEKSLYGMYDLLVEDMQSIPGLAFLIWRYE
ncbi:hypothetical protein N0V90_005139 [Kalmusia sp. IMI 367209]|nr:hypothetical protein N0V90_005139 [Kalmusia sp. IMI 367209]